MVGYKNSDAIVKYSKYDSAISDKKMADPIDTRLLNQIQKAIKTDKVYLNPQLTIRTLAAQLEVTTTTLSNAINIHYQKNFRTLINEARVDELKRKLSEEESSHFSLLGS